MYTRLKSNRWPGWPWTVVADKQQCGAVIVIDGRRRADSAALAAADTTSCNWERLDDAAAG